MITLVQPNITLKIWHNNKALSQDDYFDLQASQKVLFSFKARIDYKHIATHLIPVKWSISGTGTSGSEDIGKINSSGEYCAPNQINNRITLQVKVEMRDYPFICNSVNVTVSSISSRGVSTRSISPVTSSSSSNISGGNTPKNDDSEQEK